MKKFGIFVLGLTAAIILLANAGPLIGMAISLVILYYTFRGFVKTKSTFSKILLGIIGMIALITAISNVPAIAAVIASFVLYYCYKKWKKVDYEVITENNDDPFTNFEKQWAELNKN